MEIGAKLGELRLVAAEEELARVPLVALARVEEKGIFGRMWDSVLLMFEGSQGRTESQPSSDAES